MPEMTHRITVSGCDDETTFDIALSFDEAQLIADVARRSREASEYGCQPIIQIEEIKR